MSVFQAKIYCQVYKDNYDYGMVEETFEESEVDTVYDNTAKDALAKALKRVFQERLAPYAKDAVAEVIDDDGARLAIPCKMLKMVDLYFCTATEKDLERWEDGKIDLWNCEYIIQVEEITPVNLTTIFNENFIKENVA